MLEIKNITKYFGDKKILDDISFTIPRGKISGIIGPNGAGKTTSLRIILGILTPTSGKILYNSEELNQNYLNITGYLPEERGLYPKSTLLNTLTYLGQLKGLSFSEANSKTNYWLERLNMQDYKKSHIEELSKGNQQKIQFISTILHDPEILILDEPFSGFDPVNQTIFKEIIDDLSNDKFIILSTHFMDLAEKLCDEIFLINEGKEILSGSLSDILTIQNKNWFVIKGNSLTSDNFKNEFEQIKIIEANVNNFVIDLDNIEPSEFIRTFSKSNEIFEFTQVKPSLHQIFLDRINKK